MELEHFSNRGDQLVREYNADGNSVIAVDFGGDANEAAVDVVEETIIVVLDDEQFELDLPEQASDAHTFMKNGVLTIELEEHE